MAELKTPASARYLGISRWSFRETVKAGLIRPVRVYPFGGARYDTADLDAYRERCRVAEEIKPTDWSGFTPAMVEQARRKAQERIAARRPR